LPPCKNRNKRRFHTKAQRGTKEEEKYNHRVSQRKKLKLCVLCGKILTSSFFVSFVNFVSFVSFVRCLQFLICKFQLIPNPIHSNNIAGADFAGNDLFCQRVFKFGLVGVSENLLEKTKERGDN
jgi:hypothetical protein